ncbi:hypothetical protein C7460_11031 [Marinoscillum furvescens DSM 4134]|uniref:Uncharacterized protein n=1 Tax=Marinoscillum furvescens DSM 4134 TaxID=1122208 RepID=A0A3D9L461_MARFU|nr:hypothetical protein C7460_11031 [Marinoscillum furvescens DSM 4134]
MHYINIGVRIMLHDHINKLQFKNIRFNVL